MMRRITLQLLLCITALSSSTAQQASLNTLAPGDIIRLWVWRETDLSGDFLVNETGSVVLPKIGKINVLEIPLDQLRDRLIELYSVDLRNPSITVTPLRRVYVLGEVNRPGLLTVDPTITLAGVIALAGGATPTGDLTKLRVVRSNGQLIAHADAASSLSAVNIRSDDQVFVDRRGWLDRNSAVAVSALISAVTIAFTLLRR